MAHGSPRICICKICKSYGTVPRFSPNVCDKGHPVETITNDELKKKLGLMIHQSLPYIPFTFNKFK